MQKYLALLLTFTIPCTADPFFGENQSRDIPKSEHMGGNTAEISNECLFSENTEKIHLPLSFAQLKFVGVLKNSERIKALFASEQQQLFEFEPNDYITPDNIQITRIDLKSVYYINWREEKNCHSPKQTLLKL